MVEYGFVTEEGGKNARTFKYSGTDLSLIYKYALSPLAQFCVDHTPRWVAYVCVPVRWLPLPLLSPPNGVSCRLCICVVAPCSF